jgi:hypothetical protein
MAIYNSVDYSLKIDATTGGSLALLTPTVDKVGSLAVKNGMIENTPFTATAPTKSPNGMHELPPYDIEGEVDTTAGSAWVICRAWRANAGIRTVEHTIGGTTKITHEAYCSDVSIIPSVKGNTRFKATIEPSGAIVEL